MHLLFRRERKEEALQVGGSRADGVTGELVGGCVLLGVALP